MSRVMLITALFVTLPLPGCLTVPVVGAEPPPWSQAKSKAVVVAFLSFECPLARDYITPLGTLANDSKDATFIGVVPGAEPAEVAKLAAEYRVAFPVFADPKFTITDALGAGHTPEVFVLDAKRVVRYRGRIDDKYGARLKPNPRITRHDLADSLAAILAGQPVAEPVTKPVGCAIYRPAAVTFHKDVAPILQARCQECHRPGEAGPFSLMTYKQAVTWSDDIKEFTGNGKMPPWKPTAGVAMQHDRRLPKHEIETLAAWVDGGKLEGDSRDAPPAKVFTKGWSLGTPDLVLTVEDDFHLAANGPDHFRCFVLPTGLREDKRVVAFEVRPGNSRVVHHSVNFYDETGTARTLAAAAKGKKGPDRGPGYESPMGIGFTPEDPSKIGGLGGWTPGMRGARTPAGTALCLPKGSDVVLQLHYHRTGKAETDRTSIGLYFAKPETKLDRLKLLTVPGLVARSDELRPFGTIPAGSARFKVAGKVAVEEDCTIHTVLPHMHMLGAKYRLTLTTPGGSPRTIVAIDEWDYNWQEIYSFKEPVKVPKGSVFTVEAEFDNSAANSRNPFSPPRDVKRGEGSTDEMLYAFLAATSAGDAGIKLRHLTEKADYASKSR